MPTITDPPTDEDPIQEHYDDLFNRKDKKPPEDLSQKEQDAATTGDNTPSDSSEGDSRDAVDDGEKNPDGGWQNNTEKPAPSEHRSDRVKRVVKKYAPTVAMASLIFTGFGGVSLLLAPASLFAFMDRTANNDGSDSTRMNILMRRAYIGGMIGKADCSTKIKCKFSTISEAQFKQWTSPENKFGIQPDKPEADGRYRIKSITFPDGTEVTSSKAFFAHVDGNIDARTAFNKVVNVRSGFFNSPYARYDKTWKKYGISRDKVNDVSKAKDTQERKTATDKEMDKHTNAETNSDPNVRARNHLDRLNNGDGDMPGLRTKLATSISKLKGLKGAVGSADITSFICTATTVIRTTVALIKAKWYKDLIVFGAPFFQTFAMPINQGTIEPERAEYVGDRLTFYLTENIKNLRQDLYGNYSDEEFNLTAMDSQGVKAMIYGEFTALKEFTKQYMGWYATAAIGGTAMVRALENVVGGKQNLRDICFAANGIGLVGSVQCLSNPGSFSVCAGAIVGAYFFADDIMQVVVENLAMPAMKRIADAGLNSQLSGVRLGNALAAFIGLLLAEHSRTSGMRSAVTLAQLGAFHAATDKMYYQNTEELARYEARKDPLNPYNRYSFVSQLATSLNPHLTTNPTMFSGMANAFSAITSPMKYFSNTAKAQLHQPSQLGEETENRINMCNAPGKAPNDQELADINVLCDFAGDTAGYVDPATIKAAEETIHGDRNMFVENSDFLLKNGYINEDGAVLGDKNPDGPQGDEEKDGEEYEQVKYRNYCTGDRPATDPPGTTTKDLNTGSENDKAWWLYARCNAKDSKGSDVKDTFFLEKLRNFESYENGCRLQVPVGDQLPSGDCGSTQAAVATTNAIPCDSGWTYPTDKSKVTYTSPVGMRWGAMHQGVDLAGPIGTPIYAACKGEVYDAGPASGFGQWVVLKHDIKGTIYYSVYGHVDSFSVAKGQPVEAGDPIATIGNKGNSTGPHLHFEIWKTTLKGEMIDPATVLDLGPLRE